MDRYNRLLTMRKLRRILALLILVLSIGMILWAALPNKRVSVTEIITSGMMELETNGEKMSLPARQLTLVWPQQLRIGETETIILSFVPLSLSGTSDLPAENFTDIYGDYSMMAEGRYEVAGLKVDPVHPRRESMPAGQPLTFKWQVIADQEGSYGGTIWLSLRYLPLDGGEAVQTPIYIKDIKIATTSLLGMNESTVYLLGGLGILASAALIYDDLFQVFRKSLKKLTTNKQMEHQVKL